MASIPARAEKLNDVYCGKPLGRPVFHIMTKGCNIMGAVLGRGPTLDAAIRDWVFRAKADGYSVRLQDLDVQEIVDYCTANYGVEPDGLGVAEGIRPPGSIVS